MKAITKQFSVEGLLDAWEGALRVNPEYQRGAVWTDIQKKMLVDSVLRGYPLPLFYLHRRSAKDLDGQEISKHEVIDGQQRLRALSEFKNNKWRLLDPRDDSKKMRLPAKVREAPCPWGGRSFSDLEATWREAFLHTMLYVEEISDAEDEEVRDLFIRLQSGTSLTRQQVRDAWPGGMGPFIESIAGKGDLHPRIGVFSFVDNRGNRDDDQDGTDPYVGSRQTCAQALALFMHRIDNPSGMTATSIAAKDLDSLYHENTDFKADGQTARRFEDVLQLAQKVLSRVNEIRQDSSTVFRKLEVFSLIMMLEELTRDSANLVHKDIHAIADAFEVARKKTQKSGRVTSGAVILAYYDEFYHNFTACLKLDRLDPVRLFPADQKNAIRARDRGICDICGKPVAADEEHFDHVKPWIRGGPTIVENGRLLHAKCHPRGRSAISEED